MSLDDVDRRLLERTQSEFPIASRPFQVLAEQAGCTEDEALARVRRMQEEGAIRQIGPVFDLNRLGQTSCLCAAKVAPEAVERVADVINGFDEVTHNYLRNGAFNIWFTVIAPSQDRIEDILGRVRGAEGVEEAMALPAERIFKINVHFGVSGDAL
jgi:siroheme decarboxylase